MSLQCLPVNMERTLYTYPKKNPFSEMASPSLTNAIPKPSGSESSESCTFLIHTETSSDPFRIFSK